MLVNRGLGRQTFALLTHRCSCQWVKASLGWLCWDVVLVVRRDMVVLVCVSCRSNDVLVEELSHPVPGSKPLHFDRPYAASSWQQFLVLSKRWQLSYW